MVRKVTLQVSKKSASKTKGKMPKKGVKISQSEATTKGGATKGEVEYVSTTFTHVPMVPMELAQLDRGSALEAR